MELSPEERRRIYEEEKARIEAEKQKAAGGQTTGLKPNVAGLLCYVGFWVTGIIFLFIERRDRLVRFHAMQSLVTFGILNIIWGVANTVRGWLAWGAWSAWTWDVFFFPQYVAATAVFGVFFALWWILWGVLMYKTYHGTPYRVAVFSNLAEKCLAKLDAGKR